jgi:hypothetical protein
VRLEKEKKREKVSGSNNLDLSPIFVLGTSLRSKIEIKGFRVIPSLIKN